MTEREVPEGVVEATWPYYQFGVFPGDESEPTDAELREMTEHFLAAAHKAGAIAFVPQDNKHSP